MNPSNQRLIMGLLSLVVSGLLIYFGLMPLAKKVHEANVNVAAKKTELSKKEEKLEGLNQIKARLPELQGDLTAMNNALPKGADTGGLLVTIEALASTSGVGVASVAPSSGAAAGTAAAASETTAGGVGTLTTGLTLTAAYPNFLGFLGNLESNLRPLTLSMVRIGGGGTGQPLSINLNLVSFYQN